MILEGDCLEVLRGVEAISVDALVTDPPAGISFMGKKWDSNKGSRNQWIAWLTEVMEEALRVMKPGAHGFVWALPRTSHWTAMALEDAGFEIRHRVAHHFGTGFPKSKSMREIERPELGTALKPSTEDWWLVRKPLEEKGVARQVLATGTGALNIGAGKLDSGRWPPNTWLSHSVFCEYVGERRVKPKGCTPHKKGQGTGGVHTSFGEGGAHGGYLDTDGMETVAAYDCHESCPVRAMDEQSGILHPPGSNGRNAVNGPSGEWGMGSTLQVPSYSDTGGASRFFPTFHPEADPGFIYTPKASRAERNKGLEGMPEKTNDWQRATSGMSQGKNPVTGERSGKTMGPRANHHPTVKSLQLMDYLVTLITPPGGVILDPFAGSGSTGCAAVRKGFEFIGIEREAEYVEIARRRIAYWAKEIRDVPALTLGI